jgi:hypothetical protein
MALALMTLGKSKGQPVCRGRRVFKGHRALQEVKVYKARKAVLVCREVQAHRAVKARKVLAHKGRKAVQEVRVRKARLAVVCKGQWDRKAARAQWVRKVYKGQSAVVCKAVKAHRVRKDRREPLVVKAGKVHPVLRQLVVIWRALLPMQSSGHCVGIRLPMLCLHFVNF